MQVNRKDLIDAVGRVLPALARRELFEQADKLAFDGVGNLVTYNDEVSIFHPLPGSEGITGAIDGKRLHDLLNKLTVPVDRNGHPRPELDVVSLEATDNELVVRAGKSTTRFLLAPVTLPISDIDRTGNYHALPEGFIKALKLVSNTCARDMSRPVLTCVKMGGETIAASDSYRAAKLTFPRADLPEILLPVTAAELLVDLTLQGIAVGDRGDWARFTAEGDTIVCVRLATGNYPNLTSTLAIDGVDVIIPETLSPVLDRATIFADRPHRLDAQVDISTQPERRRITVKASHDNGRFEEILSFNVTAQFTITIHPDFLIEALKHGDATCQLDNQKIKIKGEMDGNHWEHIIALR